MGGEVVMVAMDALTEALRAEARRLGFSMVGVVASRPGRRLAAYERWLAAGYQGEMAYLARPDRLARRRDLNVILPGVQSLVCVGLDYGSRQLPAEIAADPGRGRISNYAWGTDYHEVLTPRLHALAGWLQAQAGGTVAYKVYVDTGAILERDHAESAGLGFTGKNSMLIAPRRGSWFFLGELLTTLPLMPDVPRSMPSCGQCRRCLAACPTNAFPEPYVLDARRCISYLTIELKGWIPRELRPLLGNWVFGCDVCQEVCPFNRFAVGEPVADWAVAAPPLLDLLALDEAGFAARFAGTPVQRVRRGRLVRNACVAAGNWGSAAARPALAALLADPEALIRGHAAWALGQMDPGRGLPPLRQALASESDPVVREELALAIKKLGEAG